MDIAFQNIRKQKQTFKLPIFLTNTNTDEIKRVLDQYEQHIGLSAENLDMNYILNMFTDRKIGRGLITVIEKWYYDIRGLKLLEHSGGNSPYQWRLKLYNDLEAQDLTWVNQQQKIDFLQQFAKKWGRDKISDENRIERYIFADHKTYFRIRRKQDKPKITEVIKRYNTDLIYYLFSRCNSVNFQLSSESINSELIKKIFLQSKLWGVYTELTKTTDGSILVEIMGSNELVGKSTKYGKQLYALFHSIIPYLEREGLDINLKVNYYNRFIKVRLPIGKIPTLLPINQISSQNFSSSYDSKIEEAFAKQFKSRLPQWRIKREAVIIEEKIVFIPDFEIEYRDTILLIEIVGFWTEKYLQKKASKINLLKNKLDNIILLVDEKLKFPKLDVKIFYYGKNFPWKKIEDFLMNKYEKILLEKHLAYLENNIEDYIDKMQKCVKKELICDNQCLSIILETNSSHETVKVCEKIISRIIQRLNIVILTSEPLAIDIHYLQKLQEELSTMISSQGMDEDQVLDHFTSIDIKHLYKILSYLGYYIDYDSLTEIIIYPPKTKRKIVSEVI